MKKILQYKTNYLRNTWFTWKLWFVLFIILFWICFQFCILFYNLRFLIQNITVTLYAIDDTDERVHYNGLNSILFINPE